MLSAWKPCRFGSSQTFCLVAHTSICRPCLLSNAIPWHLTALGILTPSLQAFPLSFPTLGSPQPGCTAHDRESAASTQKGICICPVIHTNPGIFIHVMLFQIPSSANPKRHRVARPACLTTPRREPPSMPGEESVASGTPCPHSFNTDVYHGL
jgi:hypothetical protein